MLLLLFVPHELTLVETELGQRMRQLRPAILSKRVGRGYLGYLRGHGLPAGLELVTGRRRSTNWQ